MSSPSQSSPYFYPRMVKAKIYMDAHYGEPLRLELMAGESYFSIFHFIRLFKKIYHLTPYQYLKKVRLEMAIKLLKQGGPLSEISITVGFESYASFCTFFKKHTGYTPSMYSEIQNRLRKKIKLTPLKYVPYCFANKHGWI